MTALPLPGLVPAEGLSDYVYGLAQNINGNFAQITGSTFSGTFTANGATAVVVASANILATDTVVMSLNTVGGTPAGAPFLSAITAGTGFQVKAVAGDTSVYNYKIYRNNV